MTPELWTTCRHCAGQGLLPNPDPREWPLTCSACEGRGLVRVPFDEAVERMARFIDDDEHGTGHWDTQRSPGGRERDCAFAALLLLAALGEGTE